MKFLTLLRVNILALLGVPLLIIAMVAKMFSKALEKAMVFYWVGIAVLLLMLLREIIKNFGSFLENLGLIIMLLVLAGGLIVLILLIILLSGVIASAVIAFAVKILSGVANWIYNLSHSRYSRIYNDCMLHYGVLTSGKKRVFPAIACLFWSLLRLLNICIIWLFSLAFPISIAAGAAFVAFAAWSIHTLLSRTFGIGIFAYLGLFSAFEIVFTSLYFAVVVAGTVVVIISLGIEWGEWGKLLRRSTLSYDDYERITSEQATGLNAGGLSWYSFKAGQENERCQREMDRFREMCGDIENLKALVDRALKEKYDSGLRRDYLEYLALLEDTTKKVLAFNGEIPCASFTREVSPLISKAETLSKRILQNTRRIFVDSDVNTENFSRGRNNYFAGCSSRESVERRRRDLNKIYHPDVGGDHDTFIAITDQYEELISKFGEETSLSDP